MSAEALERALPDTRADAWKADAACKGRVDLFFPHESTKPGQTAEVAQQVRAAKAVCAECPVRVACLDYALSFPGELHGIFGGTTQRERRNRRWAANYQRRRMMGETEAHGTAAAYKRGCSCDECRAAHNQAELARLGRRRGD